MKYDSSAIGSDEFLKQLRIILGLESQTALSHELFLKDIDDCLSAEEAFYNDSDEYSVVKFYQLNQIILSKRYAFEIGEVLFACLRKANKETHFVNTFFAFAKKLQSAAVGPNKRHLT
jgi:hypothetical protein